MQANIKFCTFGRRASASGTPGDLPETLLPESLVSPAADSPVPPSFWTGLFEAGMGSASSTSRRDRGLAEEARWLSLLLASEEDGGVLAGLDTFARFFSFSLLGLVVKMEAKLRLTGWDDCWSPQVLA